MPMSNREEFFLTGKRFATLEVLFVGHEACESGHRFGPHIRDYDIIHYVKSGRGTLYDKRGEHRVEAGEIFIIREGEVTTYEADRENPWEYIWIAFRGIDDEDFLALPSHLSYPNNSFLAIEEGISEEYGYSFFMSRAYSILHHLLEGRKSAEAPEVLLYEYIELQYMHPFSMEKISHDYGFDRSYLGRLFKKRYGISPREHLQAVKLSHAKEFLLQGYSVGECAMLCGYTDLFQFSKNFHKAQGISPSEYRKKVAK